MCNGNPWGLWHWLLPHFKIVKPCVHCTRLAPPILGDGHQPIFISTHPTDLVCCAMAIANTLLSWHRWINLEMGGTENVIAILSLFWWCSTLGFGRSPEWLATGQAAMELHDLRNTWGGWPTTTDPDTYRMRQLMNQFDVAHDGIPLEFDTDSEDLPQESGSKPEAPELEFEPPSPPITFRPAWDNARGPRIVIGGHSQSGKLQSVHAIIDAFELETYVCPI